jgi:hypothetical protein
MSFKSETLNRAIYKKEEEKEKVLIFSRKMKLIAYAALASFLFASAVGVAAGDDSGSILPPTNLLMIMFDDLRPELSIYGRSHMITPNFERLANKSVVFDYAFCQVAVCNPSRDSMLTGTS